MKQLLLLILIVFMVSCKDETVKKTPPKKVDVIKRDKPYEGKIIKIDTSLYAKFESKVLVDFYAKYNHETVWQSTEFRKIVLSEFKNAENEGLFPDDYRFEKLNKLETKINKLSDKELVDYDLLLTYNLQKYIWHISQGKLNPKGIYGDWDLKTKNTDVNAILLKAFKENKLQTVLDSCKPQHIVYKRLKKAMEILNGFPKDTLKTIVASEKINPNDTTKAMLSIKRRLMYWKDLKPQDSLTKIYDAKTVEAIKRFQTRHGLAADGVIGKGTLNALNFSKTRRKNQIMANLERWKWFATEMGNEYVIVNIPEYKLHLVENNDTIRTHRIIVGTSKRKTPILSSKLSYAVFNPTWTVPPTILKEDIIPATIKNRGYLASKNITVYDNAGNVVSASDWNPSKARSYRYVQSPGSFNSLGMVKIIFPNKFSVYLHDTNHRDYFEKWNRSLSSGCVRVENPLELTSYLLKDSLNYNLEKITEILKTGETKNASIKTPIYVHQWYWTAWSEENKLIFRDDIYNLDDDLFKKMK
jgi:murein L,D-transpeptidase YcbB/YkuD